MAKIDYIEDYFEDWNEKLQRARNLLDQREYYLEGILVLSCYIGALSRLRYPTEEKDWRAYKQIVLQYSGKKDFYEKIDLLFFCQWPRSFYKDDAVFKKLKNYNQLVRIFAVEFGDEESIHNEQNRYVATSELLDAITAHPFEGFDRRNFEQYIKLYSNCEILYRYVRCAAVHANDFPLVNEVYLVESNSIRYTNNHVITGEIIYETVTGILKNIEAECLAKQQWAHEL